MATGGYHSSNAKWRTPPSLQLPHRLLEPNKLWAGSGPTDIRVLVISGLQGGRAHPQPGSRRVWEERTPSRGLASLANLTVVTTEQCAELRLRYTETAEAGGPRPSRVSAGSPTARVGGPARLKTSRPTVFGRQAGPHQGLVPICQGALAKGGRVSALVTDT